MLITVAKISPPAQNTLQALVREEHHQVAMDPELTGQADPHTAHSPELSLITTPADPAKKADLDHIFKLVESSIWPVAKEKIPFSHPTIEGVEIVFAGKKLWDRITTEDDANRMQVALAATDFGLEFYDLLKTFVPAVQVVEPYRAVAGLIVNSADSAYAIFLTRESGG